MRKRYVPIFLAIIIVLMCTPAHAALTVLTTIPVGDTTANTVSVTFSEPMTALEKLNKPMTEGPITFTPAARGVFRWTGTSTLSFVPDIPFTKNTRYTAKLSVLTAVSGSRMQREHTWSFDTVRPRLLNSFPYNDPNGNNPLRPDAKIFLYFNMPMIASAEHILFLENGIAKKFSVRHSVQGDFSSTARRLKDTELQSVLIIEPMERLVKGARIAVTAKKEFPAVEGILGLRDDSGVSYITYADLAFTGKTMQSILPRNYGDCDVLKLSFSNPVMYRDLLAHLSFSPAIVIATNDEYDEWKSREFCLSLDYAPEKTYTLTIKPGIRDDIGQVIQNEITVRFSVGSFLPYFSMPDGSGIIEAYEGRRIPVTVINPAGMTVESKVVSRDDIIPYIFWRDGYDSDDKAAAKMVADFSKKFTYQLSLPFTPKVTRNEYHVVPLDLAPHLMEKMLGLVPRQRQYGYLALNVTGEHERGALSYTPFLQVTDLGVTTKFSGVSNFVFVTELKTGQPAGMKNIELRDDRNKKLWSGRTGTDGAAHIPGFATLGMSGSSPRQWIFVSDEKKKDEAFINSTWETGVSPWVFDIPYSYEGYPTHAGDVHTERGLYRPGETVHVKGAARELSGSDWMTPKVQFAYKVSDSRYNEVTNGMVSGNDFGTFAFDIALPKDAPTGHYSISLTKKRTQKNTAQNIIDKLKQKEADEEEDDAFSLYGSFRVEMFKPLSFETRVAVDDRTFFFGDETKFHVTGWYLFGAPMSEKRAHYTAAANETYYSPPGNPGFRFAKMHWFENDDYGARSQRIAEADVALDARGEAHVPVKLSLDGSVHAMNVTFEATVYGENEERVSGRKTILVHGSDFYIGVKRRDYFVETKRPSSIEVITVNPDGTKRDNDTVEAAVYRRYWQSTRVAGVNGRAQWESTKIDDLITRASVQTRRGGSFFTFTPEQAGLYILRFTAKDGRGRNVSADEYCYAFGGGFSPWQMQDDDRIELVVEKENYSPGETARVLIKSPYEECTALITVEREHVLTSWVTNIRSTAAVIMVPIKNSYLPNVYIGASLIKGRVENRSLTNDADLGKPSFKMGYASINVAPEERRLDVAVKTDFPTRAPGEALTVNFTVKDRQNRPVGAECEVAVCDAGVLNLIGYRTPDFFDAFYGPRPLGVLSVDSRLAIIGQRNYGKKGENPGGGGEYEGSARRELGMDLFSFRKNFLSTAFYKAAVIADKNGNGSVRFSVPDNLTTFRVMVIAADRNARFGSGESAVIVKKYLMLKPTMPRFAITGDAFEAGASVYNYTEKDADISVQIEATGASVQGIKIKSVRVPVNSSADVRFPITCEMPGTAKIRIAAKAGAHNDAVEENFPITVPRMTETVATVGSITDTPVRESIKIPGANEVFSGAGAFTVTVSPSAFSGLKGGIDYLIGYPYGCLEQKISKVMPIVLAKDLILTMKLTAYTGDELDAIVKEVTKVMKDYQRPDNGFAYWPGSMWTSPWLTAYAVHFMQSVKSSGIDIDEELYTGALDYLASYVRNKDDRRELPFSPYCFDSIDAYIASILARGGKADRALITGLISRKADLTLYARANLLTALHYAKYQTEYIDEMRQSLYNGIEVSSTTARCDDSQREGMYWIHASAVRDTAVVLSALMETGTQNPICEKLVNYLVITRQKKGRFDSTQDNVSAFAAMNAYLSVYEKDVPRMTAEIAAAGKTLFTQPFSARTDPAVTRSFDFSKFDRTAPFDLALSRSGRGRLYYGLTLSYAPRELLASRDEGIGVAKRFETLDGRALDGKQFTRGTDYVAVVTVRAPRERHFVVLDDPIPAGCIVLNRNFATESQAAYKNVKTSSRWWGSFNHFESYDDRVLAFADSLTPGEHVYRYVLRAVTPGTFALPATKVEEMYTPDVFGYFGQSFVEVK